MKCPKCSYQWTPAKSELASELGKSGGKSTSKAKMKAAKENAKLGGYPKGRPRIPKGHHMLRGGVILPDAEFKKLKAAAMKAKMSPSSYYKTKFQPKIEKE